jgi:hypothetical protein
MWEAMTTRSPCTDVLRTTITIRCWRSIAAVALVTVLLLSTRAQAHDETKYPELRGQWIRAHQRSQWDPSKPRGLGQQAPLTPEYRAIFEANLAALRATTVDPQLRCLPAGTPRMMIAYEPLEIIVTSDMVYIRTDHLSETRRIHTDGRNWPSKVAPSMWGYSIGRWIDQDGDGRYDLLEVETRHFNGPRYLDADGLPLHQNNRTIVKERIFLDKANNDLLHAEITTIDDAFTRPWTVMRDYNRERNPVWPEYLCAEANNHIIIGKERYFRSADGHLMPLRKDQPPPDLRNFGKPR